MAVDLILERRDNALVPFNAIAAEDMMRLPFGKPLKVRVTQPRSLPQSNFYWVSLSEIVQATDCAPTSKHLHRAIKMETGWTMPVFDRHKTIISHVPDSISFEQMDQVTFNQYMETAQRFLAERFGYVMETR